MTLTITVKKASFYSGLPQVFVTARYKPMHQKSRTLAITKQSIIAVLCFLIMLCPQPSHALPSDKAQILTLKADTVDLNQETHLGTYTGDVELDQGTTHLRAQSAITKVNANNKLVMAKAMGNKDGQAHYWSTTEKSKPPMHAYADEIYYYPEKNLIKLIGNARIKQGVNSFTAPEITYDTKKQHVVTQKNKKSRTTIIIHPEKHQ